MKRSVMRLLPPAMLAGLLAACAGTPSTPPRCSAHQQTERNRAIVTRFATLFYHDRDPRRAFMEFVAPDYVQHNPGIVDGRDAAIAAMVPMMATPGATFEVKRILVDGDLAAIQLFGRGDPRSNGAAVVDLYRLRDGRIVEHWDVLQPIPAQSRNPHPMF